MSFKFENKSVTQSIAKLYQNAESADVRFAFKINDKTRIVLAHKLILAASSPVFYTMFYGPINEKETIETIDISDTNASVFREFLQFFYLNEVNLTAENVEGVVYLAEKYEMYECLKICSGFFGYHVTIDKICLAYQLAIEMNDDKLMRHFEKFISIHPLKVFNSTGFLNSKQCVLKHILQLDFLLCEEIDVFDACLKWAKQACIKLGLDDTQPGNMRTQLGDCFYLIRFGVMRAEDLALHLANKSHNDLFTKEELLEIFCMTSIRDCKSKTCMKDYKFNAKPRSITSLYWKNDPSLECNRKEVQSANTKYYVQNTESMLFQTNIPLLLGEFYCPTLRHIGDFLVDLDFHYVINELITSEEKTIPKTLMKGMVKLGVSDAIVRLPRPLLIEHRKMYDIRLTSLQGLNRNYYHNLLWKTEVQLPNGDIKIEFLKSQCQSGLVSRLCFNKIDGLQFAK